MAQKVTVCTNCDSGNPALRVVGNKMFCGKLACKQEAFRLQAQESRVMSTWINQDFPESKFVE